MTPELAACIYHKQENVLLLKGNTKDVLNLLPAGSVNTCVTSPPYWGLRDYETAEWRGGDPTCKHKKPQKSRATRPLGLLHGGTDTVDAGAGFYRDRCDRCGAMRIDDQIGLEATPDLYIEHLVEVFRAVRRVLRDDGTLWVNIGDTYCSPGGLQLQGATGAMAGRSVTSAREHEAPQRQAGYGLKTKDLVGIPWMLAFALRADGWYLRADIIWHKLNPMPESVTDRTTKAHEYMFLLSKSERYFYDQDAIREPHSREWWRESTGGDINPDRNDGGDRQGSKPSAGRNKRSVWSLASEPFAEQHFAAYPRALITPCILAGAPLGGTVLDPFNGTGPSTVTAEALGCRGIGIDLSEKYLDMARRRHQSRPTL